MKSVSALLMVILLCKIPLCMNAQSHTLMGKKWIVAEYGISDNIKYALDPQLKPLVIFFSKDSATNKVDYSNIEMQFFSNATYQAKNVIGTVYNGSWSINAAGDSLKTDSLIYRFDFINAFNCITNNATIQVVDSIGTLDTLYSYVKLYGIPIITSIDDRVASGIKMYPMPVSELLTVELDSKNYTSARLYNLFGQLLRNVSIQNRSVFQMELEEFPPGYYSLEILSNDGSKVVKKVLKR